MKISYCSDIHLDFWCTEINTQNKKFRTQLNNFINNILKPTISDVLIIAGDLGHYFKQDIELLLSLKSYYTHIIITYGNHDMYLLGSSTQKKYNFNSLNRINEMKEWCKLQDNIHYIDGNTITINNIIFGGVGMSWDSSYARSIYSDMDDNELISHWINIMNDYKYIFQDGIQVYKKNLMYGDYITVPSFKPIEFFKKEREKLDNISKCDIMISHYAPKVPYNTPNKFDNSFYFFDGTKDIDRLNCKMWIYGHTHNSINEIYNDCNLLCNPIGYPDENKKNKIQIFTL